MELSRYKLDGFLAYIKPLKLRKSKIYKILDSHSLITRKKFLIKDPDLKIEYPEKYWIGKPGNGILITENSWHLYSTAQFEFHQVEDGIIKERICAFQVMRFKSARAYYFE